MIQGKSIIPVYEDTYYETSAETIYFRIKLDGNVVYEGHAERFPDGKPIRIYVNRIARDYLYNDDFDPSKSANPGRLFPDEGASAVLTLVELIENDGEWYEGNTLGDVTVVYGFCDETKEGVLSNPINGHADVRMYLQMSAFLTQETGVTIS